MQVDPVSTGSCDSFDEIGPEFTDRSFPSNPLHPKDTISSYEEPRLSLPVLSWGWLNPVRWVEGVGNALSKACHAIDYWGNYLLDPEFREDRKVAEQIALEVRHHNLIYSEQELQEAEKLVQHEWENFKVQANPHLAKAAEDLFYGAAVLGPIAFTPAAPIAGGLIAVFTVEKAIMELSALGHEIQPYVQAMNTYTTMLKENCNASSEQCVAEGYVPDLQFHPNPTKLGHSYIDMNAGPHGGMEINAGICF